MSILTDVDADEVAGDDAGETHATDVASANDGSPQWNACFVMHDKPADSPLIFIAADADVVAPAAFVRCGPWHARSSPAWCAVPRYARAAALCLLTVA